MTLNAGSLLYSLKLHKGATALLAPINLPQYSDNEVDKHFMDRLPSVHICIATYICSYSSSYMIFKDKIFVGASKS